jgi:hypothetical protein
MLGLLERDQDVVVVGATDTRMKNADIILSCNVGIKLVDANLLESQKDAVKMVHGVVTDMSNAYSHVFVVVHCSAESPHQQWNAAQVQKLGQLKSVLSPIQMTQTKHPFTLQLLIATGATDLAAAIREIGDHCYGTASEVSRELWEDTSWLEQESSQHEQFLLYFPSLNAFSAQHLLCNFTLRELAGATYDELAMTCPVSSFAFSLHRVCFEHWYFLLRA